MRQLQSVVWSKGVFLSPQHLQAQDRFVEDSLRFIVDAASFRSWGLLSLDLDHTALREGRFAVASAAGIFPDGLLFDLTQADEAPQARLLDECFEGDRNTCVFYLAVPQKRPGGVNIALEKNTGSSARYRSELQMLRDENNAGIEKPVALARKNIRIVPEGENLEGFVTLPLARVLRADAGQYSLDDEFLSPVLTTHANPRLAAMVRGLLEVLMARSVKLSGVRRQRNLSLAEFSVSDIASFWLLYTINTHLPVLQHLHRQTGAHPEQLYRQLLELAGALTTFSREIHPSGLPPYNHEHPGSCFYPLERILLELLDTVIPNRFIALPLRQTGESVFATEVEGERLDESRWYLAVAADIPAAELMTRTPALVKAGSATHLDTLIRQALPGLNMTHLPSPPQEIPIKLNYEYFSLDRAGAAWEAIKRARNFAVYVPGEIRNPRLELILVPPA